MFKLLRNYAVTSAIAILIVAGLLGYLVREGAMLDSVKIAEQENTTLARILLNAMETGIDPLLAATGNLPINELGNHPAVLSFDATVRHLVAGLPIMKLKVYRPDGITIYSSKISEIGYDKSDYTGFIRAMQGHTVSDLGFRGEFSTFEKVVSDRNIVSSYIPVRDDSRAPTKAVLEVYADVGPLLAQVDQTTTRTLAVVGVVAAILWLILIMIVRHGDMLLRTQSTELQHKIEERDQDRIDLEQKAATDSLTQAFNRAQFMTVAEQELHHAYRYDHPITALMIDIDHFKQVNDTFGHAGGDATLIAISKTITACLRTSDIFGRLGGDEFAVVLVEADSETAETVAARICKAVEPLRIPSDKGEITTSVSVGGAHAKKGENLNLLLSRADDALYEAKNAGRHTVMFDLTPQPDRLM